ALLIAAAVLAVTIHEGYAGTIQLTDSWSEGTPTHLTGSVPTGTGLSTSTQSSSNHGTVTPISNPNTQTLTQGAAVTDYLFVALPPGTGTADIPITFTLSDGTGGTVTFTDYINYYAHAHAGSWDPLPTFDDMAWTTSPAASPGELT